MVYRKMTRTLDGKAIMRGVLAVLIVSIVSFTKSAQAQVGNIPWIPGDDAQDLQAGEGFRRPGKLGVIGRITGKTPPFFFYNKHEMHSQSPDGFTKSVEYKILPNGFGYVGEGQVVYTRDIGVSYQSPNDKGDGRIVSLKFSYIMSKQLLANVGRYNLISRPTSTVGVVLTQNGGFAEKKWGVSSQYVNTNVTLNIPAAGAFPGGAVTISAKNDAPQTLDGNEYGTWHNSDPISIPHPAKQLFEHTVGIQSAGRVEIYEPGPSWAVANAAWNVYIAEGAQQLTREQAIDFRSP